MISFLRKITPKFFSHDEDEYHIESKVAITLNYIDDSDKEIEKIIENPQHLGGLVSKFNELLDALDEKKEEPKSTLREEIKYLVTHTGPTTQDSLLRVTDQIISLFKDTLLKEMKKYSNIGLVTNEDIEEIIKNL